MITYDEALEIISGLNKLVPVRQEVPLVQALGHALGTDFHAPFASPMFTNSAMDGFAFRHADYLKQKPLQIIQDVFAGKQPEQIHAYQPGSCVRIMTGAPVPNWADTVVPVERTEESDGSLLIVQEVPPVGANIRKEGEDITAGQALLPEGTVLKPEHLMVLANFGMGRVMTRTKPKVSIFSTGDELLELGAPVRPGAIYNSSRYFLEASLKATYGIDPQQIMNLPDSPGECAAEVNRALEDHACDLVITTGAVSAGEKDFIPQLALDLGFRPLFHKVAVRPGKPIYFGRNQAGNLWVGLPGNPISTATGWHFFVRPLLAHWAGLPLTNRIKANVISDIQKPMGLTCFFRAQYEDGFVKALPNQGSAHLLASTQANAYIVLSRSNNMISSGTNVDVQII